MKILFVPTSYPDESNPVRNIFIYEQAVALARRGHEIRILHAQKQPSNKLFSKTDKSVHAFDDGYAIRFCCQVKTFMESKMVLFNKKVFVDALYLLYKHATNDGWTPDCIYAHFSCWAGYGAVNLGKKYHIPVVVMEHFSGYMSENPLHGLIKGLKYVTENADTMVCVSEKLKDSVISRTGTKRRISVIPNMIDPRFQYINREENDKFVFCTLGNLIERKRVKELVIAFCKAFSKYENVELLIGGDGPERTIIQELIQKNNRSNQIIMLGRLNRIQTIELYSKSNCFVLVSAHETFGIVWREAMATGLPVITSNHEGWGENWSDSFGIMVKTDDEEQLVNALSRIYKSKYSYNSRAISQYCQDHFSESVVALQIERLLEQTCKDYNTTQ